MALTPAQIATLDTYTNAEMVKLLRWAIAELVSNPDQATVSRDGRSFCQQNLDTLRRSLETFQALAIQDADAVNAAEYGAPTIEFQEAQD